MTEVQETRLPGVGLRHDLETRDGRRVGVITHAGGRRDFLVYSIDDPDACAQTVHLDEEEAHTLAEFLGGSRVARSIAEVEQTVDGVTIDWLLVTGSWSCAGHRLRDVKLREEAGVIVVAVIRDNETVPTPAADFEICVGDTIVVVGTAEAVSAAGAMLRGD